MSNPQLQQAFYDGMLKRAHALGISRELFEKIAGGSFASAGQDWRTKEIPAMSPEGDTAWKTKPIVPSDRVVVNTPHGQRASNQSTGGGGVAPRSPVVGGVAPRSPGSNAIYVNSPVSSAMPPANTPTTSAPLAKLSPAVSPVSPTPAPAVPQPTQTPTASLPKPPTPFEGFMQPRDPVGMAIAQQATGAGADSIFAE